MHEIGDHAVVLGASMSGLLTARVLADPDGFLAAARSIAPPAEAVIPVRPPITEATR